MNKGILKLVISILISSILFSCEKDEIEKVSPVKWTKYTTADGLLSHNIHSIVVDSSDNIWVGTNMGVSRFDDSKWTNYTHFRGSPQVVTIAIDSNGDKWFGTFGGGIAKFDGVNWEYFQNDPKSSNSIASDYIRSIAIDSKGNKWIGTDSNGVSKFDGTNWTNYTTENGLVHNTVYKITIDDQENKWFGTSGGVSKFDDNIWISYSYTGDKKNGITGNGVTGGIIMDKEGDMWFATFGGLSKFDGTNWTNYTTETEWLKAGSPVLSIAIDNSGNKWFGSNGWGISNFDGTSWTTYKYINDERIPPVNGIAFDSKGTKWFATGSGLLKMEE